MVKKMFWMLIFAMVMMLTACGPKIEGTYTTGDNGILSFTYIFKSNGKVIQSAMGTEVELTYEIEGDKIKIGSPNPADGKILFTILKDGSIEGPIGVGTLRKQQK